MAQAAKKQELISKETGVAVQSAFHAPEQAVRIHNAWTLEDLVPLKGMACEMRWCAYKGPKRWRLFPGRAIYFPSLARLRQ